MIPSHLIDVDADDAVAEALDRFRRFIRATARRMAEGDADFAADLEQEAAIKLWKLDPTRFEEGDDRYLRTALFTRMTQAARNERRARRGDARVGRGE